MRHWTSPLLEKRRPGPSPRRGRKIRRMIPDDSACRPCGRWPHFLWGHIADLGRIRTVAQCGTHRCGGLAGTCHNPLLSPRNHRKNRARSIGAERHLKNVWSYADHGILSPNPRTHYCGPEKRSITSCGIHKPRSTTIHGALRVPGEHRRGSTAASTSESIPDRFVSTARRKRRLRRSLARRHPAVRHCGRPHRRIGDGHELHWRWGGLGFAGLANHCGATLALDLLGSRADLHLCSLSSRAG
mmetsp:Transcript_21492/g.54950  ORF Transcript_21492/g.54950 Transcript_21492/m.54950 type:complete len:243 (-) Transcript_21492:435-1163(-)